MIKRLPIVALLTIFFASSASAQVTVDVGQITCEQFLLFKVADPKDISIWLSGYYRGKTGGGTVLQVQDFKDHYAQLQSACRMQANYKRPVMHVLENDMLKNSK
jgi:hypothetical protein